MNAMSKLHHLFVKHLRTTYAAEKSMAAAWNAMSATSVNSSLQKVYKLKAAENMTVIASLNKVFREIGVSPEGEHDTIIESFLRGGDSTDRGIRKALLLSARAISVYRGNAITTAISSAEDLGMFDIAEILNECLHAAKFNRYAFEFLKGELEKAGIATEEFEAA